MNAASPRTACLAAMISLALLSAACAAPPPPAEGAIITLVDKGQANCVIVAGDLSPSEQWAVKELQTFLKEMSGAAVEVVAPDQAPASGPMIVVGQKTAVARHVELDLESLGDEGFLIKTFGRELVVAGGLKRGTLYGVYTLLESLGCRWWSPTESNIPKRPTLVMPPTDRREVPHLEYRETMYGEIWSDAGRLWCARNKVNGMGGDAMPEAWGGSYSVAGSRSHNTIDLVAESVGGQKNMKPEMWSLARERRTGETKRMQTEICFTHPENRAAMLKSLVKTYQAHPTTKYLSVSAEDNNDYCRCPACAAICEREESAAGLNIDLINYLAEELEKQVPGARLKTNAYLWTRKPPRILKPRHNVLIQFAPIEADYAHPLAAASNPENKAIKDDIEGWSKITRNLFIWNYVGNRAHYLMPEPDLDSMVPNVRFFVDHGAIGIGEQGTHAGVGTEFVSLRMWVLAKALWTPKTADNKLIDEFLTAFYGPAAPAIQKYINIMHEYGRKNNYHLGRFTRMAAPFLQPSILAEAEAVLREADQAAAGDPVLERRVRHAHLPLWYILAKRGPQSPTWKAVEAKVGKLDFTAIAERSNQTAKEWRIYAVADPEESAPWFQWLTDYAALLKKQSPVLPPELKPEDLAACRVIQARQIDSSHLERTGQWVKMEGASDGWVLRVIKPGWLVQHTFSPYDEYTVGRSYELAVRIKGSTKKGDGVGFVFGLFGDATSGKLPTREVPAADLADGQFHVVTLGPFTAGKNLSLFMAISRDASMPEVYFDCMWLREIYREKAEKATPPAPETKADPN